MKKIQNKPGEKWWNEKPSYRLYYIREYSGILIALWALYWIGFSIAILIARILIEYLPETNTAFGHILFLPLKYYFLFTAIGLAGAVIHTITWLQSMPNIFPFRLSKFQKGVAFGVLILVWIGLSAVIYLTIRSQL